MESASTTQKRDEQGFALIVAILALMLLTFLGLTLATTTSTELQIATNYRWGQQALYNAEAGIEVGKVLLARNADPAISWAAFLPVARNSPLTWYEGGAGDPDETPAATGRDFDHQGCDTKANMGYGLVLDVPEMRAEGVTTAEGQTINGAFTLWVRRRLISNPDGQFSDAPGSARLVLTAEGVAPYGGVAGASAAEAAFIRSNQAVRVLELPLDLVVASGFNACTKERGQEGLGASGDSFDPCGPLFGGGSLGHVFGGGVTATAAE